MAHYYESPITLTLLGPLLTAGTGAEKYGIDKTFHRNYQGRLVIPASHIKGKVRMALEELTEFFDQAERPAIADLFGASSDQEQWNYAPSAGMLRFSDFQFNVAAASATRVRVTMHPTALTAAENLLREIEDAFASGQEIRCVGKVGFYAQDSVEAEQTMKVLAIGLMWIANWGAEKSVGFGRLKAVSVEQPQRRVKEESASTPLTHPNSIHLRIKPQEPIHIGGIKSGRTNYSPSRRVIPGGVIKGALTEALNRAHGVRPVYQSLSKSNAVRYPEFSALAENFDLVRVTNALATHTGGASPVHMPISTVEHLGQRKDTALRADCFPISGERAPLYFIDWKHGTRYFDEVFPKEIFVTRAEIDGLSQRSRAGQLFTYSFICPTDEAGEAIEWVCNVDFTAILDKEQRVLTCQQFGIAIHRYLHHLGKLKRAVQVTTHDGPATVAQASKSLVYEGLAIVTLQSNTLMLNPEEVRDLAPHQDLHALYAAYWQEVSRGALQLEDFFAHQSFEGGYLYHRFLGAMERKSKATSHHYRPYYLTQAGSVFRLRATDESAAEELLSRWRATGLPLPSWAEIEYGQHKQAIWELCPFVPGNGCGEIAVNLAFHWDEQL